MDRSRGSDAAEVLNEAGLKPCATGAAPKPGATGAGPRPCATGAADSDTGVAAAGTGFVRIERRSQQSVVTRAFATSPLRLLNPRNHGHAAWIYTATYGGGLVGGDAIALTVDIGPGANALLSTQASTKIYRSPLGAAVDLRADVGDGALLVVAPDPVVCFTAASYRQDQRFDLAASASLVVVDWLTSGRRAMGERWAFDNYVSRLTIHRETRLLMYDALSLRSDDGDLRARLQRFDVVCVVIVVGIAVREPAAQIVARVGEGPVTRRADLVIGASRVGDDGCVVRLAGVSVEAVAHAVREYLAFLPAVLGDDPWTRKW